MVDGERQLDPVGALPPLRRRRDSRVVDERVEAADAALDLVGETADRVERCEVGEDQARVRAAPAPPDLPQRLLAARRVAAVEDERRAAFREVTRHPAPEPVGAARDEDRLLVEWAHAEGST